MIFWESSLVQRRYDNVTDGCKRTRKMICWVQCRIGMRVSPMGKRELGRWYVEFSSSVEDSILWGMKQEGRGKREGKVQPNIHVESSRCNHEALFVTTNQQMLIVTLNDTTWFFGWFMTLHSLRFQTVLALYPRISYEIRQSLKVQSTITDD